MKLQGEADERVDAEGLNNARSLENWLVCGDKSFSRAFIVFVPSTLYFLFIVLLYFYMTLVWLSSLICPSVSWFFHGWCFAWFSSIVFLVSVPVTLFSSLAFMTWMCSMTSVSIFVSLGFGAGAVPNPPPQYN